MLKSREAFLKNNANQHQCFSIRKLTIGATSVLLGSLFFLGGYQQEVKADSQENDKSQEKQVADEKQTDNSVPSKVVVENSSATDSSETEDHEQTLDTDTTKPYSENELQANATERDNQISNQKNDLKQMHFTGGVDSFEKTTPGSFPQDKTFHKDDTAKIVYKLQGKIDSKGSGSLQYFGPVQGHFYDTASDYLVTIPKGFEAVKQKDTYGVGAVPSLGWAYGNFDETNLGNVGKNGEQMFLVHTDGTPYVDYPITLSYDLKAKPSAADGETVSYSNSNPLVVAVTHNGSFVGDTAETFGGKTYHVADVNGNLQNISYQLSAIRNTAKAIDSQDITFTPDPENNGKFVTKHEEDDHSPANYELKGTLSFKPGTVINDGDYINFKLGLNDQDGNVRSYFKNLDTTIIPLQGDDAKRTIYGNLYAVNGRNSEHAYYQIKFNSNAQKLVVKDSNGKNGQIRIDLKWADKAHDTGWVNVNTNYKQKLGSPYAYQQTNDASQNGQLTEIQLNNDLDINGKKFNSGAPVLVEKIYSGGPTYNANPETKIIPEIFPARRWDGQGRYAEGQSMLNGEAVFINTDQTSDDFDIIIKTDSNPAYTAVWGHGKGKLVYVFPNGGDYGNWKDDKNIDHIGQITGNQLIAPSVINQLSNRAGYDSNNENLYFVNTETNSYLPNVTVTVTGGGGENAKNINGQYVNTLHFHLVNNDDPNTPVKLRGRLEDVLHVVLGGPFGKPNGINNYKDDLNNSVSNGSYNHGGDNPSKKYFGAKPANEEMLEALENTKPFEIEIVNKKTGQTVYKYHQSIQFNIGHPTSFNNSISATPADESETPDKETQTAKLHFIEYDAENNSLKEITIPGLPLSVTGKDGKQIMFSSANDMLAQLAKLGYEPVKSDFKSTDDYDPSGNKNYDHCYLITVNEDLKNINNYIHEVVPELGNKDWKDVNNYTFGNFGTNTDYYFWMQKKTPSEPTQPTQRSISEYIHFIDENGNALKEAQFNGTVVFTKTNDQWDKTTAGFNSFEIPQTITVNGKEYQFDHTKAENDGKNVAAITVTPDFAKDNVDVYLYYKKKQTPAKTITDTKKVKETINFYYDDDTTPRDITGNDLYFNKYSDGSVDQDQSFAAFDISPKDSNYQIVSAVRRDTKESVLEGHSIKAIPASYGVNDIVIDVHYKKKASGGDETHKTTIANEIIEFYDTENHHLVDVAVDQINFTDHVPERDKFNAQPIHQNIIVNGKTYVFDHAENYNDQINNGILAALPADENGVKVKLIYKLKTSGGDDDHHTPGTNPSTNPGQGTTPGEPVVPDTPKVPVSQPTQATDVPSPSTDDNDDDAIDDTEDEDDYDESPIIGNHHTRKHNYNSLLHSGYTNGQNNFGNHSSVNPSANDEKLPDTGSEADDLSAIGLIGIVASISMIGMVGIRGKRKIN